MLNSASLSGRRGRGRHQQQQQCLIANLSGCKFPIVKKIIEEMGFEIDEGESFASAFLIWSDVFVPLEKLLTLQPYQRVNHFPGMVEICRKDFFTKNYNKQAKRNSEEYNFYPKTWLLPQEHNVFQSYARKNPHPAYILKPANGAMGLGIRLYRSPENVPATGNQNGPCVVQEYIGNPLLIEGYKCDLRVYVLVTSCCPLRIFVYNEGLVRLSAEKYMDPMEPNGESVYRHLTNYALNRKHSAYVKTSDEGEGSKRSFAFLDGYLQDQLNIRDTRFVWRRIRNLVVKTVILGAPHIYHGYRLFHHSGTRGESGYGSPLSYRPTTFSTPQAVRFAGETSICSQDSVSPCSIHDNQDSQCSPSGGIQSAAFEILGFDILLDVELRPWLIEVNRSPSFGVDQDLDLRVKSGLLRDTLSLLNIRLSDKRRSEASQKARSVRRLLTPPNKPIRPFAGSDSVHPSNGTPKSNYLATDWLKNPKELLRRIADLKGQLRDIRREADLECFENSNCGDWRRVYPTMDHTLEERYAKLLVSAFTEFNKGRPADVSQVIQVTQSGSQQEEELKQQLYFLEKEAAKLFKVTDVRINRRNAHYSTSPASRCLRVKWPSGLNQSAVTSSSLPFWDDPDAVGDLDSVSLSSSSPSISSSCSTLELDSETKKTTKQSRRRLRSRSTHNTLACLRSFMDKSSPPFRS